MKCTLCKDTGLIPLTRKDGITVPFAWVNCDCYTEPPERYAPVKEGYIDFPCSQPWREFYDETLYGIRHGPVKDEHGKVTIVSPEVTPRSSELTHIRTLLIETRDAQQAHFKHHSNIGKKKIQRKPII